MTQSHLCIAILSSRLHHLSLNYLFSLYVDNRSEATLKKALVIRKGLARKQGVASTLRLADTLYELGVLEVKKHQLESAATYLQQALSLRRSVDLRVDLPAQLSSGDIEASCAATLHQLAAVEVQKKPPSLHKAELLLQEALGLRMQIGQRAATLKQLARVSIRQGSLAKAESYLAQALEHYVELYGENAFHINVAAVKFQLGALACQREQLDDAWTYFTECLMIRKRIYGYARPLTTTASINGSASTCQNEYPAHLDVSAVLHELACVAFAQTRYEAADDMLQAEKEILERLQDTSSQPQRIHQALLTNLTWLKKCAAERGDDERVKAILHERFALKRASKQKKSENMSLLWSSPASVLIQHEAIGTRSVVRQYALASPDKRLQLKSQLLASLDSLGDEAMRTGSSSDMIAAAIAFRDKVRKSLADKDVKSMMLEACDELRDVLREHGITVQDKISRG